jgi:hypothetical protein
MGIKRMSGQRFIESISHAYRWLPRAWRCRFMPGAEAAFAGIRRLVLIMSQLRLRIFSLQGIERTGGRTMTVLVLGNRRSWPYLAEAIFSRLDAIKESGGIFIWRVRRHLASLATRPDMVIVHADGVYRPLFKKLGLAHLPEWVTFKFDLSRPSDRIWEGAKNKNLRENLRRIRKYGYSYEITTDPVKFDAFYREMYLPYIPRKFGESAELVGPRFMRLFFEGGLLLMVSKEGEDVSGSVITTGDKGAKAMIIGVKEGSGDLIRKGALAACYYFTILWAKERGYRSVDFGECRPFFDDGLFYFKKRWGMTLEAYRHRSNIYGLWVGSPTPAALDFLGANPFIIQGRKGLEGRVLAGSAHPLSLDGLKTILRSYLVPGLDRLVVVSIPGFDFQAEKFGVDGCAGRVALIKGPAEALFSEWDK